MSKLQWNNPDWKFQVGVSNGVLYVKRGHNSYGEGVAWSGLTKVTVKTDGGTLNRDYADNGIYSTIRSPITARGSISAYMYPDEWILCKGGDSVSSGVQITGQKFRRFGMTWRTQVREGDRTDEDLGRYRLHILWNAEAIPDSEFQFQTLGGSPHATTYSWSYISKGVKASAKLCPTSLITIDSGELTDSGLEALSALEDILYGDDANPARLPTPPEVIAMFDNGTYLTDILYLGGGKLWVRDTYEHDCRDYEAVQVRDANLLPENIKKGTNILGTVGTFQDLGGDLSDIEVKSGVYDFIEVPADGYYGIGKVTVRGDPNLRPEYILKGKSILGVAGTVDTTVPTEVRSITVTSNGSQSVWASSGRYMTRVNITTNVPEGVSVVNNEPRKSVYPKSTAQTITFSSEYTGLSSVYIYSASAGDSNLKASNIAEGVTIYGITGTHHSEVNNQPANSSSYYTPGTSSRYLTYDSINYTGLEGVYVKGDSNLIPANIANGVSIFGVAGTLGRNNYQHRTVTPSRYDVNVYPTGEYDAMYRVTVSGDNDLVASNIRNGVSIFGVTGSYVGDLSELVVVLSNSPQEILPATGFTGFSKVIVPAATGAEWIGSQSDYDSIGAYDDNTTYYITSD